MHIRLIQPPLVQPLWRQLTLPVVGAEFKAQGFDVTVCDENIEPLDESLVDAVGITCHVYNAPRAFEIAGLFRGKGVPVIIGGTFPTVAPDWVEPHADAIVMGELEGQTEQIAHDLRKGKLASCYRATGEANLEKTLQPDFSLLQNEKYFKFTFPLETSRGCRFNCKFCTTKTLYGKSRTRSLADIERDLRNYDHGLIEIIDVNFLNDCEHFLDVLPLLKASSAPGWTGQTTINDLACHPKIPQLFSQSGCRSLFVGLESNSIEGLKSVSKSWSDPKALKELVRQFHDEGILVQAGVIVGLETDNEKSFDELLEFLNEAGVHAASLTYLHYYPGTKAYSEAKEKGRLVTEKLDELDGDHPAIKPAKMTTEELQDQVCCFTRSLYSLGAIFDRTRKAKLLRYPTQLLHHLLVNLSLRDYYRTLITRPAGARNKADPRAKFFTDMAASFLRFLWSY